MREVCERESELTRTSKKSFVELYISLDTAIKKNRYFKERVFLRPSPPILSGAKKKGVFKEESSYGHHHPSSLVQKKRSLQGRVFLRPPPPILSGAKKRSLQGRVSFTATTTHPLWCKKKRSLQGRVFLRPPPPIDALWCIF